MNEKRTTALILEKEPTQRSLLVKFLENRDYEVLVAESGSEGLKLWEDHLDIRVVIVDLEIPEIDGLKFIETIRAGQKRDTYVIILVERGDKKALLKGVELDADDFLYKPLAKEELAFRLTAVSNHLRLEDTDRPAIPGHNLTN